MNGEDKKEILGAIQTGNRELHERINAQTDSFNETVREIAVDAATHKADLKRAQKDIEKLDGDLEDHVRDTSVHQAGARAASSAQLDAGKPDGTAIAQLAQYKWPAIIIAIGVAIGIIVFVVMTGKPPQLP